MILRKLTLKNFRQFRGLQEITFASPDMDNSKNVTVIFGENGRGKTGIFRAIMFCLYGDHSLSQDAHIMEKELHLVNAVELQESTMNGRKPVEAFVEVEFSHKRSLYKLKRSLLGMLDGSDVIEQLDKVSLFLQAEDGNTRRIEDLGDINRIVNSILDQRVKEYFLFDGEKIERLTRASLEQRREISKGLRNLLNIDTLEIAIKATSRLRKILDSALANKSTGEYARLLKQLEDKEKRVSELKYLLEQTENEIELATDEKRKIDKEFEKIKEIKDLLEARSRAEAKEKDIDEQLKGFLGDMKNRTGKTSLVLMADTIEKVFSHIDQRKQKGEIPSEIRKDLIERILSDQRCICGREIIADTEPFRNIILWKDRTSEVVIEDFMLELWRHLSGIRSHFEDVTISAETLLQNYAVTKNEIEKTRIEIRELNEKIGSSNREDAVKLEKLRQNIEKKLNKLEANRIVYQDELLIVQQEYERLIAQRREKEKEEKIKNELSERALLASKAREALGTVHDEFTKEIKTLIGESATQIFNQLIDIESRETLHRIIVNDDYSIQILDKWGKPFLANISAGQRQIMSISFIAALAKAAAHSDILEMPLFMDSPFGRLSYEHRKNLITHIPNLASQWILLATDTEFRRQEAQLLKNDATWGKFYILKGGGAGVTRIELCDLDDAFAYLKDEGTIR